MSVSHAWELSSDAELITAVRSGDSSAFGVLYERHEGAARTVARQYSNSTADAEDAVSDAFARVFSAIQGGGGPDVAFRAYLFTVVRRVALTRVESGRRAVATDDLEMFETAFGEVESTEDPTMAGFERGIVSQAYRSLPERWQAVLWYSEVEELTPAQIAPILGLTSNGVAALAYRAREGLRQAYLQQHLAAPTGEACTLVNSKLGAYVRGGLAKRETALVESHLEECGTCRGLVLELGDVNHGMRVFIGPLVLGAAAIAAIKGVGFGGLAGAVGAGGAAGSGAAGAGVGGAGGATASGGGSAAGGTGTGGGATGAGGAGGAGGATTGAGVGGTSAGVGAGAGAGAGASAGGAGVGSLVGTGSLVGAGASAAGAGAAAAAATGGGLAAVFGGIPMIVVGVATAGVLTAGGLGVAGVMGAFSGPENDAPPLAAPTDDGATGEAGTGGVGGDGAGGSGLPGLADGGTGTGEQPPGTDGPDGSDGAGGTGGDATSPANIPSGTGSGAPATGVSDPGTGPGGAPGAGSGDTGAGSDDAGTGDPGAEDPGTGVPGTGGTGPDPVETPPGDDPGTGGPGSGGTGPGDTGDGETDPPAPRPANLVVADVGELSFVAGVPTLFSLEVSNDGEQGTGVVHTVLAFEPDVDWKVEVQPEPPGGHGTARAAAGTTGWTCGADPADASRALCTLPDLPGATTSTLAARMVLEVDGLRDASRDLRVGFATWAPGLRADRPEPTWFTAPLASAPAEYEIAVEPGFDQPEVKRGNHSATVRMVNVGGTTGSGLGLKVSLPPGLLIAPGIGVGEKWSECEGGYCLTDLTLAPGEENAVGVPLSLVVGAAVGAGAHEVGVTLTDAAGTVRGMSTLTVPVAAPTIAPAASIEIVEDSCWFEPADATSYATATVTLDNSASDVPVEFAVAVADGDDTVIPVAAGAISTTDVEVTSAGAIVRVSAGDWSDELSVPAFDCAPPPPVCPPTWQHGGTYEAGDVVADGDSIYRALWDLELGDFEVLSRVRPTGPLGFLFWEYVGPCEPSQS